MLRSLKSLNTFYGFYLGLVVLFLIGPISVLAETFQTNVRVDDTGNNVINQYDSSIAVDDTDNIYIVWTDERNGNSAIYFAKSTNHGLSFSANIKVNDAVTSASNAAITIDGNGNVLVVWQDERNGNPDIYFTRSTDNGANFGTNVRVDDTGTSTSTQSAPALAVDTANNIYVVWTDDRDSGTKHIYLAKSTNGGTSFNANIKTDDAASVIPDYSAIAIDETNNHIYVVWKDTRSGPPDIYFAKSMDGGANFTEHIQVNDFSAASEYPGLAVDDSGNIYVAWHDFREGNADIYLAKNIDATPTFSANVRVDDSALITSTQRYPTITVNESGKIYLAWEDERNGNLDIYLAQSIDASPTFSANIRVDDTGTSTSEQTQPEIAVDNSDYLYVVWIDKRRGAGDSDIYFATTYPVANVVSGSSGDDSGKDWKCFIATAAYGTPMADDVVVLRRFRDKYLLTHPLGRIAVNTYYRLSPRMAEIISKNKTLRGAVRIGLAPLVGFARGLLNTRKNRRVSMISEERR